MAIPPFAQISDEAQLISDIATSLIGKRKWPYQDIKNMVDATDRLFRHVALFKTALNNRQE